MNERQGENQNILEINFWDIFNILWKKAGFIVLFGLFCALLTFGYTNFFATPQFISTTKIYIMSKQNETTLTQGDMQTSTYLTKDYAEMIKSRTVTEKVIMQLGLDMSNTQVLDKMSVNIAPDARIISISVKDKDPYKAAEIADKIREVASEHIRNVMDIETVNVVEEASIPLVKSSPNVTRVTLIGGVVASILLIITILFIYLTNDTIQISDDIEKKLGISVLSVIPMRENSTKSNGQATTSTKRKKEKDSR